MFSQTFSITESMERRWQSALQMLYADGVSHYPKPGVYNGGVITIIDEHRGDDMLRSWQEILGLRKMIALIVTGLGNVVFTDRDSGEIHFLDIQTRATVPLGDDPDALLNDLLMRPAVLDTLIRRPHVEDLIASHRVLFYPECFILKPWRMFGGNERQNPYDIGSSPVHIELVAQTHILKRLPTMEEINNLLLSRSAPSQRS